MSAVEVWVRADVVSVRLTKVPVHQAGSFETLILRALVAGADTRDDLADIFGLAPRLIDGLLGDLWRTGRISIDLGTENERISVTSSVRVELERAKEEGREVASSERHSDTESLAHERLTGRVLPLTKTRYLPKDRRLVVPRMSDDPSVTTASGGQLIEALTQTLQQAGSKMPPGRDDTTSVSPSDPAAVHDAQQQYRVDEAYLAPDLLQPGGMQRFVPLRVWVSATTGGDLRIQVIDEALTLEERERATSRLQRLVEDEPKSTFVRGLRGRADHEPLEITSVAQLVTGLQDAVEDLGHSAAPARQRCHDRATYAARQLDAYTRALAAREMDVTVIQTGTAHRDVIDGLLRNADRQVVMAVPWVRSRGVEAHREDMLDAVRRGVQITLLWGIVEGPQHLEHDVRSALDAIHEAGRIAGRGGGLFFNRERGSRVRARVVVADDRQLLVTSKNFLSGSTQDELGLLLTAVPRQSCPVAEDILQFLYERAPDPSIAVRLIRTAQAFGRSHDELEPNLSPVILPRLTAALLDPDAPAERLRTWTSAWQEVRGLLIARATRPRPTVEVLIDGLHAPVVREALATARHRVLVTSDTVTGQALTEEVVELVAKRASEGVGVALRYARERVAGSSERLARVDGPRAVRRPDVRQDNKLRARVVVADDVTVLGSFNHLSVDTPVRGRRAASELSVRVHAREVADSVIANLLGPEHHLVSAAPGSDEETQTSDRSEATAAALVLQDVLEALQPTENTELPDVGAAVELIARSGAEALLPAVNGADLSLETRQQILAAAVLFAQGEADDTRGDVEGPLVPLVRVLWERGEWACAALLRAGVDDEVVEPRHALVEALSRPDERGRQLRTARWTDAPPGSSERDVLRVATAVGLLLGELDDPSVIEPMQAWDDDSWTARLAREAADYWMRLGPLPAVIPDAPSPAAVPLHELWARCRTAVEELRRYDPHSESGSAVRAHLFGTAGEMTALTTVLAAQDSGGLRRWQETHRETDDSRWLTKAARVAGQPNIADNRRPSFIAKRRAIRLAVRAVLDAAAAEETRGQGTPKAHLAALDALRTMVSEIPDAVLDAGNLHSVAVTRTVNRLRRRLRGESVDASDSGTELDSWRYPQLRLTTSMSPEADAATTARCRTALLYDLAGGWRPRQAVRLLVRAGEFRVADFTVDEVDELRVLDSDSVGDLRKVIEAARGDALAEVVARVQELRLRRDRAGVDDARLDADPTSLEGDSLVTGHAHWEHVETELAASIDLRRRQLRQRLDDCRGTMQPAWARHVEALLDGEEFVVAEQALAEVDGRPLLPNRSPLPRWAWRTRSIAEAARWLRGEGDDIPARVPAAFAPQPADSDGLRLRAALQAVAENPTPAALREWLGAVQSLVVATDAEPEVRTQGAGIAGHFVLPFDQRLPRLRWAGTGPVPVTVGDVPQRALLHLSIEMIDHAIPSATGPAGVVIDVSDVLSLMGHEPGATASTSSRALQLLGMICSRQPLEQVINPRDVPAQFEPHRRTALAWLLAVIGFSVTAKDLDLLRMLGGGHPVVVWRLLDAARADPMGGLGGLHSRPDLAFLLRHGLREDVADDAACLVLATLLEMDLTDPRDLPTALETVCEEHAAAPDLGRSIDIDAAIDRLASTGYLQQEGERLRTCGCPAVVAFQRSLSELLPELVARVDAQVGVRDRVFRVVSELALHNAKGSLLTEEEIKAEAWKDVKALMSNTAPVDLRALCKNVVRRADRDDVDVIWMSASGDPVWVAGSRVALDQLIGELVANAAEATSAAPHADVGTVYVELRLTSDAAAAELVISDDGLGFADTLLAAFAARRPMRGTGGRGNGLEWCRRVVALRGDQMTVESAAAGGGVVTIRFAVIEPGDR